MENINLLIGALICGVPLIFVTVGVKWLEKALFVPHRRRIHLLGFGVLFVTAVLLVTGLPLQNPALNLLLIPFVLSPAILSYGFVGLAHLVSFLNKRDPRFLRMALVALLLVPGIVLLSWRGATALGEDRADKAATRGRERGDLIYEALQSLTEDTGDVPASLDSLVPSYLSELPTLPRDGKWLYSAKSKNLAFRVMNRCCVRKSDTSQWDCQKLSLFHQCAP